MRSLGMHSAGEFWLGGGTKGQIVAAAGAVLHAVWTLIVTCCVIAGLLTTG